MSILPFLLIICASLTFPAQCFNCAPTAPVMGIGALLFRPRGMSVQPSLGNDEDLVNAGKFFTDAFWTGKVGGGAKTLSLYQQKTLERQQVAEFRRRYGNKFGADRTSEMLLCTRGDGTLMGCAGIEVDKISRSGGRSTGVSAPLMSNVAVGRKFRRKGVAEELVRQAELLARRQWGYDECYLLVEKRNAPAIRLYRKMGYRRVWEDKDATTLIPTPSGKVATQPTILVCMKKRLGGGILGNMFGS